MIKNFIQRTLTGFLFVASILLSIYFQATYYTFSLLFFGFTSIALFEFYRIVNSYKEVNIKSFIPIIAGLTLYVSTFLIASGYANYSILAGYAVLLVGLIITELYRKQSNPFHNIAFIVLGQIFIALPFSILTAIACNEIYWLFALFILIWVYDSCAYMVGVMFGKHRMIERISPKKSWEGFIGGFILTLVATLIFAYFTPDIAVWKWLLFGVLIVIFGTWGDLTESLLKRTVDVKDSGNLLPGHGGVLDRFDSLLLLAPIVYFFLLLI
jgi:phosphatidate cytidylyltransferase